MEQLSQSERRQARVILLLIVISIAVVVWRYTSNLLISAAANGNVKLVKRLVDIGYDLERTDHHGLTPLELAVMNNQIDVVRLLLQEGAGVYHSSDDDYRIRSVEVARLLVRAGWSPVNEQNVDHTALQGAARDLNIPLIKYLIFVGANVNTYTCYTGTPLCVAIQASIEHDESPTGKVSNPKSKNPLPAVKLLLDKGADPNVPNGEYRDTPLVCAIRARNAGVAKLLIERGAKLDAVSGWDKEAPLDLALDDMQQDMAILLFEQGVQTRNPDRKPLLHWAIRNKYKKLAFALVQHKSKVNQVDSKGKTALHLYHHMWKPELINALIANGADVNAVDKSGNTPLHFASYWGEDQAMEILIKAGAKENVKNSLGWTPSDCYKLCTRREPKDKWMLLGMFGPR